MNRKSADYVTWQIQRQTRRSIRKATWYQVIPAPSPLLRLLTLRHPVHTSKDGKLNDVPPEVPTFLLLRRDRAGRMQTDEIGVLAAGLLAIILDQGGRTGRELLEKMLEQAPPDSRPTLKRQGEAGLRRFHQIGVLLGAYR